jgi:hypothetical protein
MLAALTAAPRGAATPAELMAADPAWFAGVPVRSATASLHLTAASLARKGLVTRGRRSVDRHGDGRTSGGPRLYQVTDAGRRETGQQTGS